MSATFYRKFTALPEHIDANGHVNNAVWVRWMEEVSVAHWLRDADPAHVEAYGWVVTRHEIDYRGNVGAGATVLCESELRDIPKGARYDRYFRFTDADGRLLVQAKTSWAMVDKASGRLMRVPPEVYAPFAPAGGLASSN